MKLLFFIAKFGWSLLNEETSSFCSKDAIQYTLDNPPIVAEWDEFKTHWYDVTDGHTHEVNNFFLDTALQSDVCLGLRYRMADPDVQFASAYLTGSSIDYEKLKKPDWLESDCSRGKCEIKLCCPKVTSRNTVEPNPDCSNPSVGQFDKFGGNNVTFDANERFWTHTFDGTHPSKPGKINPVFFDEGWRTDLCRGLRLKMDSPTLLGFDFPFESFVMGQGKFETAEFIPDSMAIRCVDPECTRFQAQVCCLGMSDDSDDPLAQLDELFGHIESYMTEMHSKEKRFQQRMTNKMNQVESKMKKDFKKKEAAGLLCSNHLDERFTDFLHDDPCEAPGRLTSLLDQWSEKYNKRCDDSKNLYQKKLRKMIRKISSVLTAKSSCTQTP